MPPKYWPHTILDSWRLLKLWYLAPIRSFVGGQ